MSFIGTDNFDHDQQTPRVGVLLTNLGTPAAPTRAALRPYLKQFLSDPRVVEAFLSIEAENWTEIRERVHRQVIDLEEQVKRVVS